jgi:hypothetical protein
MSVALTRLLRVIRWSFCRGNVGREIPDLESWSSGVNGVLNLNESELSYDWTIREIVVTERPKITCSLVSKWMRKLSKMKQGMVQLGSHCDSKIYVLPVSYLNWSTRVFRTGMRKVLPVSANAHVVLMSMFVVV